MPRLFTALAAVKVALGGPRGISLVGSRPVTVHDPSRCPLPERCEEVTTEGGLDAAVNSRLGADHFECHAGHGFTYATSVRWRAIPNIVEQNIGQFLTRKAMITGH